MAEETTSARWWQTVRGRLYLAFTTIFLIALLPAIVALQNFTESANHIEEVISGNVPVIRQANELSVTAGKLEQSLSLLVNATTQSDRVHFKEMTDSHLSSLEAVIENFPDTVPENASVELNQLLAALGSDISILDSIIGQRLTSLNDAESTRERMKAQLETIDGVVQRIKKDAGFDLSLAFIDLASERLTNKEDIDLLINEDFANFQFSTELEVTTTRLRSVLGRLPDADRVVEIAALETEFNAGIEIMRRNLQSLGSRIPSNVSKALEEIEAHTGAGENVFTAYRTLLALTEEVAITEFTALTSGDRFLRFTARFTSVIVDDAAEVVGTIQESVTDSQQTVVQIALLGVFGVILVIVFIVTPQVVRPITQTSIAMRSIAMGFTKVPLPKLRSGEIGQMVGALEHLKDYVGRVVEAERATQEKEAELRLAMDNMPGGMILTDKNLIIRQLNTNFLTFVGLPANFLKPGDPHEKLLRYMAEHGYYGDDIDVDAVVQERLESVLNPTQDIYYDHLPNGNINAVRRQKTPEGDVVTIVTDVTEQMRSQEASNRLKEAMDIFSDSLILYDRDERVVFTNEKYHEFYPNSPSKDEITGRTQEQLLRHSLEMGLIDDPVAKDDPETWLAEKLTERRANPNSVSETKRTDGKTLLVRSQPTTEGGHIITHTDITERKTWEHEIARQKAILEITLESMDQGISMFNGELFLTALNSKFMEMMDLSVEDFPVGTHLSEMLRFNAERGEYGAGDIETQVAERLELAAKFEPHRFERQRPDGSYVEVRGNPLPDKSGFVTTYTDITERKLVEERIAAQEASLRMTLDNMPGGICMLDGDLRIQVVNDKFCELYGHPRDMYREGTSIKAIVRYNIEHGIHNLGVQSRDDVETAVRKRINEFRSGVAGDIERDLADGRTLHIRHNPIEGGGVVLIATDVTARKRAEKETAAKQEQLTDILDNVQQGVVLWDEDKKPIAWNALFPDALSIDEEILNDPEFDLRDMAITLARRGHYGEGDPEELANQRVEKLWSDQSRTEVSFDGIRTFDALAKKTPGGRVVVAYTDITDRKNAETSIARQEERIRAIMESVPDAVVTMDTEAVIQSVNAAAGEIFGYEAEELIGQSVNLLMPDEIAEMHDEFVADYLYTGEARFLGHGPRELEAVRKSGEHFPIDISLAEARVDNDRIFIGVMRDITERKEAERILATKESQLRMAMENMPGGMVVVDPNLELILVNETYRDYYGDPEGLVKVGANMADLLESETKRGMLSGDGSPKDIMEARLAGYRAGESFTAVDRTPDGRHIQMMRKPIEGGYTISVAVDITELKKTERELANKEAMLTAALENMSGGLFMIDADLKLRVFNDRLAEYYDIPRSVMKIGAPLDVVLRTRAERGDYGDGDIDDLVQARIDGYRHRDVQIVTDRVQDKIIEVYRAPMEDGGMVCVFNDVTERKQAEEALSKAHSLITESLSYASRIQRSLLPPKTIMEEVFTDHTMIWEPTDMVGGDMVWLRPAEGGVYLIVADCTGHGPPGAFMTMICTGALDQSLAEMDEPDPADVLHRMNLKIKSALGQDSEHGESDDGVELGVCHIDTKLQQVTFAGARFSLCVVDGGQLNEVKGNRSAIGYRHVPPDVEFDNHTVTYKEDMQFYLWTDGMVDQIGGPKRRSFGKRRLRKIILDYHQMKMGWQRSQILREFEEYQHAEPRRDDITLVGFVPR